MKLYKLRFQTADKTADDIKKDYRSNPPNDEMCEKLAEAYRNLTGAEFLGASWEYSPDTYSLYNHLNEESHLKLKEFLYLQEQDEYFGNYINDRERFDEDWDADHYEPSGALHFNKNDFEVIEQLS